MPLQKSWTTAMCTVRVGTTIDYLPEHKTKARPKAGFFVMVHDAATQYRHRCKEWN